MMKYLLSIFAAFLVLPGVVSADVVSYTTPGTYFFNVPLGVTNVTISAVAGGGGGGANYGDMGGGGGSGAGVLNYPLAVTPGATYTIMVGAGGAGGWWNPPTSGYNGSATSFGGLLVLGGGGGGYHGNAGNPGWPGGGGFGGTGGTPGIGGNQGGQGSWPNSGHGGATYWHAGGVGSGMYNLATRGSLGSGGGGGGTHWGGNNPADTPYGGNGFLTITYTVPVPGTVNVSSNIPSSWTITGPATIPGSGTYQSSPSKPVGTYTITWGAVSGYNTPATQGLTLTSGSTITFNGTYTPSAAVPTIASPTVTSITTTGATLGANVTSPGLPATISSRGTCWGTTPAPVTNCAPEGGATTGVFTHARTGMTPNTPYYYRGYAVNSTGTGYSPSGSFTTAAIVNGTCGSSNLSTFSAAPSTNLCSAGTATAVVGSGPWLWNCNGLGGGTNTSCQAFTNVVAGSCGSANGTVVTAAPTTNLCSYTATAPTVTGIGPWNWTCSGANGGANASCAAGKVSCGDGICSVSENPVSCAKDCKVRYRTF